MNHRPYRKVVIDHINGTKNCTECGVIKPFAEFYKNPKGKLGLAWVCISCDNIRRENDLITSIKGKVISQAYGTIADKAAFQLMFQIGDDVFKVSFPVLPSKTGNLKAAKVQAATILYHDVKAKIVLAKVLGTRAAFFTYLLLPDGRAASEAANPEIVQLMPKLLASGG